MQLCRIVTVLGANWWSAQVSTHDQSCKTPRVLARGSFSDWVLVCIREERVLIEQDGQVVPIRVRVELIRDVWNMIGCLLQ